MKIFALAVLLALVQAPSPVPRKAANSPASAGTTVKNQSQNNKAPTAQPQSVGQTVKAQSIENQSQAVAKENTQEDVNVTRLPIVSVEPDWGTWIFSGLLVLVGLLQAWLLYRTWGQIERQAGIMNDQLVTMQGQLAAMNSSGEQTKELIEHASNQADAMLAAAEAASLQAEAATSTARATLISAEAARDNVELIIQKERARLRVEITPLKFNVNAFTAPIAYEIHLHGSSDAFEITSGIGMYVSDSGEPSALDRLELPMGIPSVITQKNPKAGGEAYMLYTFDKDEIAGIQKGDSFVHVEGFVKYKDVFERQREVRFKKVWTVYQIGDRCSGYWMNCGKPQENQET